MAFTAVYDRTNEQCNGYYGMNGLSRNRKAIGRDDEGMISLKYRAIEGDFVFDIYLCSSKSKGTYKYVAMVGNTVVGTGRTNFIKDAKAKIFELHADAQKIERTQEEKNVLNHERYFDVGNGETMTLYKDTSDGCMWQFRIDKEGCLVDFGMFDTKNELFEAKDERIAKNKEIEHPPISDDFIECAREVEGFSSILVSDADLRDELTPLFNQSVYDIKHRLKGFDPSTLVFRKVYDLTEWELKLIGVLHVEHPDRSVRKIRRLSYSTLVRYSPVQLARHLDKICDVYPLYRVDLAYSTVYYNLGDECFPYTSINTFCKREIISAIEAVYREDDKSQHKKGALK